MLDEKAEDKVWFANIVASFNLAIKNKQSSQQWLARKFKNFGIYAANNKFQEKYSSKYECTKFALDFLEDGKFGGKISCQLKELQPGYIILYRNEKKLMHIAIYVGIVNNTPYAISKFGVNNVFIHPVSSVPANYGNPNYDKKIELKPAVKEKLKLIEKKLTDNITAGKQFLIKHWETPLSYNSIDFTLFARNANNTSSSKQNSNDADGVSSLENRPKN